jgi:hypothetical protein
MKPRHCQGILRSCERRRAGRGRDGDGRVRRRGRRRDASVASCRTSPRSRRVPCRGLGPSCGSGSARVGWDDRRGRVLADPGEDGVAAMRPLGEVGLDEAHRDRAERADGSRRVTGPASGQGEAARVAEGVGRHPGPRGGTRKARAGSWRCRRPSGRGPGPRRCSRTRRAALGTPQRAVQHRPFEVAIR